MDPFDQDIPTRDSIEKRWCRVCGASLDWMDEDELWCSDACEERDS